MSRMVLICIVLLSIIFVSLVWIGIGIRLPEHLVPTNDQGQRGQWGDQFGAINSLFSGLAFAGLLIALFIQNKELTHAIEGQRDAMKLQANAMISNILLLVTDEIRTIDWGDAHAYLRLYHRNPDSFHRDFSDRRNSSLGQDHDKRRRIFMKPVYKVWHLANAGIVDDDFSRAVLGPDLISTVLDVIEPLNALIRSNYDRSLFEWARSLYTEHDLKTKGAYVHASSADIGLFSSGK